MTKTDDNVENHRLADAINKVSSFLANEEISNLETCPTVDCIIICVSALVFQAEWLFSALEARPSMTETLILVGGIGHSTKLLWDSIARHDKYKALEIAIRGQPEASVMETLLRSYFDVQKIESAGCRILIEDKSTNCGSNAIETRKVIEGAGLPTPKSCIIIQDPTMSLRTLASFQKAYGDCVDPPEFKCCPLFIPTLTPSASGMQFANDIPSHNLWSMDRFLELVLGEIPRLRDDKQGYGPNGKGFIGHIDMPSDVEDSWQFLKSKIKDGASGRSLQGTPL